MDALTPALWDDDKLKAALEASRTSLLKEGLVTAEVRVDRLRRAIALVYDNGDRLVEAMADDFGHRTSQTSWLADIAGSLKSLKVAQKNLSKWMKDRKQPVQFPLGLMGVRGKVSYQPKGVVGIIGPWNYPVSMIFQPLAGALAAGNRVMLKPSEHTPRTSALIAELIESSFAPEEITVVTGGPDISAKFSQLPLDHIFFTGATSIGKIIMGEAAKNLTPVTLELGGKSPVIVGQSAPLSNAAEKLAVTKLMNAGQTCVAPDYVMIDEGRQETFVKNYSESVAAMYPKLLNNDEYTSVVNRRHYDRLNGYLDDARDKGADVRVINPAGEDFSGQNKTNKMPPVVVLNVSDDMKLMQEEIFGPILPVRTTATVDDAIDYVNKGEKPLALYYFGADKRESLKVRHNTSSGAFGVNESMFHVAQETLPFGGVGASGMGNYHGEWGFKTFSHERSVFATGPKFSIAKLAGLLPPYGKMTDMTIKQEVRK